MSDPLRRPDTPDQPVKSPARSPRTPAPARIPGSLLVLGAAAVLTVYGAGFERTRLAAQQFADESAAGRRPLPPSGVSEAAATEVSPAAPMAEPAMTEPDAAVASNTSAGAAERSTDVTPSAAAVAPAPISAPASASAASSGAEQATSEPAPSTAVVTKPAAAQSKTNAEAPVAAKPTSTATAKSTASDATTPAAAIAVATTPVADTAVASSTVADSAAAAATAPPAPVWKDGTYTGWGTSRHGDIQVTLVITSGRIESADISRCETRYSCSWINHLQPQVVKRQSADVDYVSGATQSANAFYYAVLEALGKAK